MYGNIMLNYFLYLWQQLIQAKMECKQFENELKAVKQSQLEEKKAEKSSEGSEDKVILNKSNCSVLLGNGESWTWLLKPCQFHKQ